MRYEIREMSLGGILDQGIVLFRDHFKKLYLICCCVYLPFLMFFNVTGVFVQETMQHEINLAQRGRDPFAVLRAEGPFFLYLVVFLIVLGLIALPITNAAVIYAIAEEYQGRRTSVKQALRRALPLWLPMIWTAILSGLVIGLGFLMCIVPGVIFALFYYIINQVVVIEGQSGVEAMRRSWNLMKGNIGNAFILSIVIFIIQMCIMVPPQLMMTEGAWPIVEKILESFFEVVVLMFNSCVFVAMYFSGRCKHEQFDMYMLAQALGRPAPAAAESDLSTPEP